MTAPDRLRLYAHLPNTRALGPGLRFALWVQGCPRRCPGCMTPDALPFDSGYLVDTARFAEQIASTSGIEGITVSGGEPFTQAGELSLLVDLIREKLDAGVVVYTGHTLDELGRSGDPAIAGFLKRIDTLIDGPYVGELDDGSSLRGSSNQNAVHLTARYAEVYDRIFGHPGRNVEIHMLKKEAFLAGIPGQEMLGKWKCIGRIRAS